MIQKSKMKILINSEKRLARNRERDPSIGGAEGYRKLQQVLPR